MKNASLLLLVVGTIVATLGGARMPTVDRTTVAVGLVIVVVGAVLARLAARGKGDSAGSSSAEVESALAALRALPAGLASAASGADSDPLDAVATRLAALQRDAVDPLSERAAALLPQLGGERFARIFGPYASAERALGRARSAATDGHRDEVVASLARARAQLDEAAGAAGGGGIAP